MQHGGFSELELNWSDVAKRNLRAAITVHVEDESYNRSGQQAAEEFFEIVGIVPSVMDFGCGDGRITRHLATVYRRVVAVDLAPEMLEKVESLALTNVTTTRSNGTDLSGKVHVHAIFSDSVLMHNRKADVEAIFANFARCISSDDKVVFQLPVYETGPKEPDNWTDVGIWTPDEIYDLATDNKFYVDKIWINTGRFSFEAIGPVHHRYHVLRKA